MSLSGQVGLLATRIGTEIKSIRNSYVPNTLRGPIGGVNSTTGASGIINLDPTLASQYRLTATGDITFALMGTGSDGQRVLLEVQASGGQRVLTFDAGYELSSAVPTRTLTVSSGAWAYVSLLYRSGTWRLTSAEPQAAPDYSAPSTWLPSDHGLVAWSYDPLLANATYVPATNGQMFGTAIKLSSTQTVSTISHATTSAGSGFTAGRNLLGLYNSAGSLLASTVSMTTAWGTTGGQSAALTAPVSLTPGTYYVNFLVTATTPPGIAAAALPVGLGILTGRSPNAYRGYWYSGVPTSLPNPRTTPSGGDKPMWVGFS